MAPLWIERTSQTAQRIRLRLEGQLVGRAIVALEEEWRVARAARQDLILDLAGLTFIGPAGADLLRRLRDRGVELVNAPPLIAEVL